MNSKFKVWMAGVLVFAISCSFCCWVLSGVNLWQAAGAAAESGDSGSESIGGSGLPVIVIDAGHGGMDGGASSADGTVEKDLTLAIALALEEAASEYKAEIIMTRTEDAGLYTDDDRPIRQKKREDLLRRREIIEAAQPEVAVSIHLNSFPQDASVYGAQVFYPGAKKLRTNVRDEERTSRNFAESVQKSLEINIPDGRKRSVMTKDDILLFEDVSVPIILVECGFLSNEKEAKLLRTAEYQRLLAEAIWKGINEILYLEKKEEIEIIYSTNKIT